MRALQRPAGLGHRSAEPKSARHDYEATKLEGAFLRFSVEKPRPQSLRDEPRPRRSRLTSIPRTFGTVARCPFPSTKDGSHGQWRHHHCWQQSPFPKTQDSHREKSGQRRWRIVPATERPDPRQGREPLRRDVTTAHQQWCCVDTAEIPALGRLPRLQGPPARRALTSLSY